MEGDLKVGHYDWLLSLSECQFKGGSPVGGVYTAAKRGSPMITTKSNTFGYHLAPFDNSAI